MVLSTLYRLSMVLSTLGEPCEYGHGPTRPGKVEYGTTTYTAKPPKPSFGAVFIVHYGLWTMAIHIVNRAALYVHSSFWHRHRLANNGIRTHSILLGRQIIYHRSLFAFRLESDSNTPIWICNPIHSLICYLVWQIIGFEPILTISHIVILPLNYICLIT